jgi:hypothetical protein
MNPTHRSRFVGLVATLAASIGLALGMIVPGTAALAAPPTFQSIQIEDVACSVLAAGDAQAYLHSFDHSVIGSDGGLQLWIEPDDIITDPPTFVSGAADLSVGPGDSGLFGTFDIVTPDGGRVVGSGSLEAHYTPDGEIHVGGAPKSTGNERVREEVVTQPMTVAGTLTLDLTALGRQIVMPLDGCFGNVVDVAIFANDPASSVTSFEITQLSCTIVTDDATIQLYASEDLGLVAADGVVQTSAGNYPFSSEAVTLTLSSFGFSARLEAVPGGGHGVDGAPGGTLTASAELERQPKITWTGDIEGAMVRVVQQDLSVSGVILIALEDGTTYELPMSDSTCYAFDYSARAITNP